MKKLRLGVAVLSFCCPFTSLAQVQKCVDASGAVTYTNQACPTKSKAADLPITTNVVAATPRTEVQLPARMDTGSTPLSMRPGDPPRQPTPHVNLGGSQACSRERANLKTSLNSKRPTQAAIEAAREAVRRACEAVGEDAQPQRTTDRCLTTSLSTASPFLGNFQEVLVLLDGTAWQITSATYEYMYEYAPNISLCASKGFIVVKGKKFDVQRLN